MQMLITNLDRLALVLSFLFPKKLMTPDTELRDRQCQDGRTALLSASLQGHLEALPFLWTFRQQVVIPCYSPCKQNDPLCGQLKYGIRSTTYCFRSQTVMAHDIMQVGLHGSRSPNCFALQDCTTLAPRTSAHRKKVYITSIGTYHVPKSWHIDITLTVHTHPIIQCTILIDFQGIMELFVFSPSLKSDLMSMIGAAVDPEGDGASPMRPGESLRYQILGVPLLGIPQ